MRNAFAREMEKIAASDPRIVLLSGDIGNRMFDQYKASFPDRFYNCGISEQNMIGMAAGLAMAGFRPVCYTITPFITYRCLEQIRVDLCYHQLPVLIVGVGGGLAYASLGATHHACEDIAMLRSLPNMRVACPGDAHEVTAIMQSLFDTGMENQPAYLRLGKKNEPRIHHAPVKCPVGGSYQLQEGEKVCFLSCGNILPEVMKAAESLASNGIRPSIYSMPWVKPLNQVLMEKLFKSHELIVTVEEHSHIGGFGSAICEWRNLLITELAEQGSSHALAMHQLIAASDDFLHTTGDQAYARIEHGLNHEAITQKVINLLSGLSKKQVNAHQHIRLIHPKVNQQDHQIMAG